MARKYRQIDPRIWDDEEFRALYAGRWDSPSRSSPASHPWPFDPSRWKESHCVTQRNRLKKKRHREKAWAYIVAKFGSDECLSCGSSDDVHLDHVLPVTWGGTSDHFNLQSLCAICNSIKGQDVPCPPLEVCNA